MRHSLFFSIFIFFPVLLLAQTTAGEQYQLANQAYEQQNYSSFLTHIEKANELRPNHRTILYNLAIAYTLNKQFEKAVITMSYRASFYAVNDFSEDEELASLKELSSYKELLVRIEEKNVPLLNSTLHFEFQKEGFHPEGIVIHPETGDFLLSDVRCGILYSYDKEASNMTPLLDLKDFGFWGAMGMSFDKNDPNILWVTTSALSQFCEYTVSLEGKSAVLKIDLKNKKLISSYSMMNGNHVFGDLITTKNGTVYITDSSNPIVYRITEEKNELEVFLEPKNLFNLQGLALGDDNTLYLSDYITGVYSVDLATKEISPVLSENQLTRGTDGLYYSNDQLYLMQNGTIPFQVAKVDLLNSCLEILDRGVPELNEPTLGTIKNGTLYFIANSPWVFYDENNAPQLDEWPSIQIRKLVSKK